MRRSAITFAFFPVLLLLAFTLSGCGGSSPSTTPSTTVKSIVLTPATISMNKGDVLQLSATTLGDQGGVVAADVTYSSSDTSVISVSSTGNLCAGTWDANNIVCTPATKLGTADIIAKAQDVTLTTTAYVHQKVDIVRADPPPSGCVSMGETAQLTARSFSNDSAVCSALTPPQSAPCQFPASSIGSYTWKATDTSVVSLDNTAATNGVATGLIPGQTSFFASISGNNSPAQTFTTCPVASISLKVKDSTAAPFTFNKADTKTLVATVTDSKGKALDGTVKGSDGTTIVNLPPILWNTTQPFAVASGVQSATEVSDVVTALNPGPSLLSASCSPNYCNKNVGAVFSNPIFATVSGTAGGTVYAASTTSLSLIPIDVATNTAGTAITLPRTPNSMVANSTGTKLLLGADTGGVMFVDTVGATVSTLQYVGKVIGTSADGTHAFVNSTDNDRVFYVELTTGTINSTLVVTGNATAGDTTPDGRLAFVVVNAQLYTANAAEGQRTVALPGVAKSVAVLASGPVVYVPSSGTIDVRAACQPGTILENQTAVSPTLVKAVPNGDGAVVVDSPNLIQINNVNVTGTCPPTISESRTATDLQGGSFTARQLLVSPNATLAFVTNDTAKLLSYNLNTHDVKAITLAGGATQSFTGGITLDSAQLYVGAKDGSVHRIDTSTLTDVQQIAVGLKNSDGSAAVPDLVVVRNK